MQPDTDQLTLDEELEPFGDWVRNLPLFDPDRQVQPGRRRRLVGAYGRRRGGFIDWQGMMALVPDSDRQVQPDE